MKLKLGGLFVAGNDHELDSDCRECKKEFSELKKPIDDVRNRLNNLNFLKQNSSNEELIDLSNKLDEIIDQLSVKL